MFYISVISWKQELMRVYAVKGWSFEFEISLENRQLLLFFLEIEKTLLHGLRSGAIFDS